MMKLRLPKWLLVFTSKMYIHRKPLWFVYDPHIHQVKGHEVRDVLRAIQPGDVLLRSFSGYLDTMFIPGYWSHAALYAGEGLVIHAIGTGVQGEDILDFCRCDGVAVLRIKNLTTDELGFALKLANACIGKEYDYEFETGDNQYYCSELVACGYPTRFVNDFEMIGGNRVITPEGIYRSKSIRIIAEFRH